MKIKEEEIFFVYIDVKDKQKIILILPGMILIKLYRTISRKKIAKYILLLTELKHLTINY